MYFLNVTSCSSESQEVVQHQGISLPVTFTEPGVANQGGGKGGTRLPWILSVLPSCPKCHLLPSTVASLRWGTALRSPPFPETRAAKWCQQLICLTTNRDSHQARDSQGMGQVRTGRQWSQHSSIPSPMPPPLNSAMCQPTCWSWHRGKAVCARKQVWCRLFPCWSNEEAIETLGVAIWLLTPFLLQHNPTLLRMGAGLSAGPHPVHGAESGKSSTIATIQLIFGGYEYLYELHEFIQWQAYSKYHSGDIWRKDHFLLLQAEEIAAKENETGNQKSVKTQSNFCSTLCVRAMICHTTLFHTCGHFMSIHTAMPLNRWPSPPCLDVASTTTNLHLRSCTCTHSSPCSPLSQIHSLISVFLPSFLSPEMTSLSHGSADVLPISCLQRAKAQATASEPSACGSAVWTRPLDRDLSVRQAEPA